MLREAYLKVRDFHLAFNHPAPDRPTLQSKERAERRSSWVVSEMVELYEADTLVDQADAYVDCLYFCLGGLVELGVDPGPLFDIVHNANMAKLHLIDGKLVPVYHPDSKVKKPEGWVAPEPLLEAEVERQLREVQAWAHTPTAPN